MVENNCTKCTYFLSYYEAYFEDEFEPEDQGFCRKDQNNNNYGDIDITCDLFKPIE